MCAPRELVEVSVRRVWRDQKVAGGRRLQINKQTSIYIYTYINIYIYIYIYI